MKRRTPLKRSPFKRSRKAWGAGRRRRGPNINRTKYARRERDTPRMLFVKTLPCALVGVPVAHELWSGPPPDRCRGRIEAHHAGRHGMSEKAPDDTVIAMCSHHHRSITGKPGGRGCFDGWPPGSVKEWELAAVEYYQRMYDGHRAAPY